MKNMSHLKIFEKFEKDVLEEAEVSLENTEGITIGELKNLIAGIDEEFDDKIIMFEGEPLLGLYIDELSTEDDEVNFHVEFEDDMEDDEDDDDDDEDDDEDDEDDEDEDDDEDDDELGER